MSLKSKGAVFLDRDGTINHEVGYIQDLSQLKLIPGSAETIRALNQMGILVILVTNQSGVARGYYSERWLVESLHHRLIELLAEHDAHLDALYYCPHLPEGTVQEYAMVCPCRKPESGMLLQAQQTFNINHAHSFMIGDKASDVEAGKQFACQTILLRSGYGEKVLKGEYQHIPDPDYIVDNLFQAYEQILLPYYKHLLS